MSDQCNHVDLWLDPAGKVYLCKTCSWNFVATPAPSPLREPSETPEASVLADRLTEYLAVGGFFNPEILNVDQHREVSRLMMDCRDFLRRSALPVDTPPQGDWRIDDCAEAIVQQFGERLDIPDRVALDKRIALDILRNFWPKSPPVDTGDRERINWLEVNAGSVHPNLSLNPDGFEAWWAGSANGKIHNAPTLREAIDRASQEGT